MSSLTGKTSKSLRSTLLMMLISLVSLIAMGCGDSQQDYVFTNDNNPGGTGNVVFQFVQAQQGVVPTGTASLIFDFYSTSPPTNGNVVYSTPPVTFANTVTVTNVPVEAQSVVITCYDADGHPIGSLTDEVTVLAGQTVNQDLSNALFTIITFDSITVTPDPVNLNLGTQDPSAQLVVTANFSNGESIAQTPLQQANFGTFDSSNDAAATVTSGGLVEAVAVGFANISVSYELDGETRTYTGGVDVNVTSGVTTDTLVVLPQTLVVEDGTESGDLFATIAINGNAPVPVDIPGDDISFALQSAVTGISVNANSGEVTVDPGVADGTDFVVVATFDDGNGNTATDTVAGEVGIPAVVSVEIVEPVDGALELPDGGFQYQVRLRETYQDATVRDADPSDYTYFSATPANGTISNAAGFEGILTTAAAGTSVITVEDANSDEVGSFTLTSSATSVDSTTITPDTFNQETGDRATYRVTVEYANGNTEDVTSATQSFIYAVFDTGTDVIVSNSFGEGAFFIGNTPGNGTYDVQVNGGYTTPVVFTPDSFSVTATAP